MIQVSAGQAQGSFALDKGDPGPMAQRLATLRARGITAGNEYLQVYGWIQSSSLYPPVGGPTVSGPRPPGRPRHGEGSGESPLGPSMGLGAAQEAPPSRGKDGSAEK